MMKEGMMLEDMKKEEAMMIEDMLREDVKEVMIDTTEDMKEGMKSQFEGGMKRVDGRDTNNPEVEDMNKGQGEEGFRIMDYDNMNISYR